MTSLQDQLQQVVGGNMESSDAKEPPKDEQNVAAQLLRLLPVEDVEALDTSQTLDAAGITSLDRIEFAIKVEQQLGVTLSEDDYGPASTIADVLALVEQRHASGGDAGAAAEGGA